MYPTVNSRICFVFVGEKRFFLRFFSKTLTEILLNKVHKGESLKKGHIYGILSYKSVSCGPSIYPLLSFGSIYILLGNEGVIMTKIIKEYCTRAIIIRDLYNFYLIFTAVYIVEQLVFHDFFLTQRLSYFFQHVSFIQSTVSFKTPKYQ